MANTKFVSKITAAARDAQMGGLKILEERLWHFTSVGLGNCRAAQEVRRLLMQSALLANANFKPDEPRDQRGRWTQQDNAADSAANKPPITKSSTQRSTRHLEQKQTKGAKAFVRGIIPLAIIPLTDRRPSGHKLTSSGQSKQLSNQGTKEVTYYFSLLFQPTSDGRIESGSKLHASQTLRQPPHARPASRDSEQIMTGNPFAAGLGNPS